MPTKRKSNAKSRKAPLPVHEEREDGGQESPQKEEVGTETRVQTLADGSVRYRVMCDGGLSPSGVYWEVTLPADAGEVAHALGYASMKHKSREAKALGG